MKNETMAKIAYNSVINGKRTTIGKYVYRFDPWTGDIYRTEKSGLFDCWEKVANIND